MQFAIKLLALAFAATAVAEPEIEGLRGVMTAVAKLNGEFPLVGYLEPRQGSLCEVATDTPCADGNGCCPVGRVCAYTTSGGQAYPICRGECGAGAVTCTKPITACCNAGQVCGADGFCAAGGLGGATSNTNYIPSLNTGSLTRTAATYGGFSSNDYGSSLSASLSSLSASLSSQLASVSSAVRSATSQASAIRSSAAAGGASANMGYSLSSSPVSQLSCTIFAVVGSVLAIAVGAGALLL